jgi:hypothetical protein
MHKTDFIISMVMGVVTAIIAIMITSLILEGSLGFLNLLFVLMNLLAFWPLLVFGGALAGLIFGTGSAYLSHFISRGKIKTRVGAICGGLAGGILVGLAPIWSGVGIYISSRMGH